MKSPIPPSVMAEAIRNAEGIVLNADGTAETVSASELLDGAMTSEDPLVINIRPAERGKNLPHEVASFLLKIALLRDRGAHLTFEGYEDDPRELHEIPECCAWALEFIRAGGLPGLCRQTDYPHEAKFEFLDQSRIATMSGELAHTLETLAPSEERPGGGFRWLYDDCALTGLVVKNLTATTALCKAIGDEQRERHPSPSENGEPT